MKQVQAGEHSLSLAARTAGRRRKPSTRLTDQRRISIILLCSDVQFNDCGYADVIKRCSGRIRRPQQLFRILEY
jgi:hypothetical protein